MTVALERGNIFEEESARENRNNYKMYFNPRKSLKSLFEPPRTTVHSTLRFRKYDHKPDA